MKRFTAFSAALFALALISCSSPTSDDGHTHEVGRWTQGYYSDENTHFHICSICGAKMDIGEHSFVLDSASGPQDEWTDRKYTCSVCGYTRVVPAKQHTYNDVYSYDAESHWKACVDAGFEELRTDEDPHTMTEWTITYGSSPDEPGQATRHCTVCPYTETKEVDPLTVGDFEFALMGEGANAYYSIQAYTGYEKTVKIPARYKGLPVKEIDSLSSNRLVSLVIPKTIVAVRELNCPKLKEVTYPGTLSEVRIGEENAASWEKIVISEGTKAFKCNLEDLPSLKELSLPDSLTEIDFSYGRIQDGKLPSSLDFAKEENGLSYVGNKENPYVCLLRCESEAKSIVLPEGVRCIASYAFSKCGDLEEVVYPSSLVYLGERCFDDAGLRKVTVPGFVNTFRWDTLGTLDDLEELTLEEGVEKVQFDEFPTSLKRIALPATLTEFSSFKYLSLDSLTLAPNSPRYTVKDNLLLSKDETILYCAFDVGKGDIVIPDTVTTFETGAITATSPSTGIFFGPNVTTFHSFCFSSRVAASLHYSGTMEQYQSIQTVGSGYSNGYHRLFIQGAEVKDVTFDQPVSSLVFNGNVSLVHATFTGSVKTIPDFALEGCSNLTIVNLSEGIESIGKGSFGLTAIRNLTIPDSAAFELNAYTHWYYPTPFENIRYLTLGANSTIGEHMTAKNVKYLFPDLTVIVNRTSLDLQSLKEAGITVLANGDDSPYRPTSSEDGSTYFDIVLDGEETILQRVYSAARVVTVPDGVTRVADGAFWMQNDIREIVLPDSVTAIEGYLPDYLYRITLGSGLKTYDAHTNSPFLSIVNHSSLSFANNDLVGPLEQGKSLVEVVDSPSQSKLSYTSDGCYIYDGKVFLDYAGNATSLAIPQGIVAVWAAIDDPLLESLTIPEGVKRISLSLECPRLENLSIPSTLTFFDASLSSADHLSFYEYENGLYLGNQANPCLVLFGLKDKTEKAPLTIAKGTVAINEKACYESAITSVRTPTSLRNIGKSAFEDCGNLREAYIEEGVTEIGSYAFASCENLFRVSLPQTYLDKYGAYLAVFTYLYHSIYESPFGYDDLLREICVPASYKYPTMVSQHTQDLLYPEMAVRAIHSFSESLVREENGLLLNYAHYVTIEGTPLFVDGAKENPAFCELVRYLGEDETVTVPTSIQKWSGLAFSKCESVKKIVFEGSDPFVMPTISSVPNLECVEIPASITGFLATSFRYCPNLTKIVFRGTVAEWNAIEMPEERDWPEVPSITVECTDGVVVLD